MDMIMKIFSSISDSKSFSRNTLIEEAINKFINESEKFLYEEHGFPYGTSMPKKLSCMLLAVDLALLLFSSCHSECIHPFPLCSLRSDRKRFYDLVNSFVKMLF